MQALFDKFKNQEKITDEIQFSFVELNDIYRATDRKTFVNTIFVELKILLVLVPKLLMNVLVAMIKVELEAVKKKNAFDATNMAILQMNAR